MPFRKRFRWPYLLLLGGVLVAVPVGTGTLEKAVRANPAVFQMVRPAYWSVLKSYHAWVKDAPVIENYLHANPVRKLQLGAGDSNAPGWLNSDFEPERNQVFLDVTERFPLPDSSIHYIFSEHLIEHVPYEAGLAMLRECHRVLAPGGRIRTVTPNLGKFARLLTAESPDDESRAFMDAKVRFHQWPVTPVPAAFIFNRQVRDWGHQFLYDAPTLRHSLEQAGFRNITEHRAGQFSDRVFREVESRSLFLESDFGRVNQWEAMVFEAER